MSSGAHGQRGRRTAIIRVLIVIAFGGAVGCGGRGNTGTVSGVVTLNGDPLARARIRFQPETRGAPSSGFTDDVGRYELRFSRSAAGAVVGDHRVEISTFRAANPDADPPMPALAEQLPPKYNAVSELRAVVMPGSNTIDFSLEASGKIPQPKTGDY